MVVPMENLCASSSKSKKYIGNGLVVHLRENNSMVTVVGNECRIKIEVNDGTLKVVGNSCHVKVRTGNGEIRYNGNEGRIKLGAEVDEKNVTYVGNEGKIYKEVSSKGNTKNTKDDKKTSSDREKPKAKEVPLEKTRRSSRNTLNVISKSDKHFSLSESVLTLTVPSAIAVPHLSETVIKIRRVKSSK